MGVYVLALVLDPFPATCVIYKKNQFDFLFVVFSLVSFTLLTSFNLLCFIVDCNPL